MNPDLFFNFLDKNCREEIMKRLPHDCHSETIFYDTAIQYLISLSHIHEDYDGYALRLSVKFHEKNTQSSFVDTIRTIQSNKDISGNPRPLLNAPFFEFIMANEKRIETLFAKVQQESEPFRLNYFGWKTLTKSYLIKTHQGIVERLDHMWFRIALFLHLDDWGKVEESFRILRTGQAIHATPTLFNAGLHNPQMASCFLLGTEDSVQGIYKTIGDAAIISKFAGGIGIHISNVRGKNSYIYGTNGYSNGIMPMLRVYNDTSRYIDQCFEPSTLVVTNRGMIPIVKIRPYQDMVLTNDGTFQRVLKKLAHRVEQDVIRVQMRTPWNESVDSTMTRYHDMRFFNPNAAAQEDSEEYVAINNAGFGHKTVYIQPCEVDLPFSSEDIYMLGYLYSHLTVVMGTTWELTIPHDHLKIQVEQFLDRHYQKDYLFSATFYPKTVHIDVDYLTILDQECLKMKDFPFSFCLLPREKLAAFLHSFATNTGTQDHPVDPKILFMRYRLADSRFGDIKRIETINAETNTILYDLEVENNHNYQTILGLAHNGGGKRKGAFAMYIEPWHVDIFDFVMAKRNVGNEEERTRDLFLGLWIPDEFMRRVETDQDWYLMSESECPGLSDTWGEKFETLYHEYYTRGKFVKKIRARDLWYEILRSQIETGNPYILYKDTCNRFSNQQNLGTIRSSNLCCEIIEYSDHKEYAVCNLSSISLISCIRYKDVSDLRLWIYGKENCIYCTLLKNILDGRNIHYVYFTDTRNLSLEERKRVNVQKTFPIVFLNDKHIGGFTEVWNEYLKPDFDFVQLGKIVRTMVENLNIIIDKNEYPLPECKTSNLNHRPIGIGVTGLADLFMEMLEPYDSPFARSLNKKIFESMYYYALQTSNGLAIRDGPYKTFKGSPLSKGIFHFEQSKQFNKKSDLSLEYDWESLRKNIVKYGVRNSLMIAPMPTASTSQILGNTESFEPLTSNFYVRRTLAGEFYVINKYLRQFLKQTDLWNNDFIHSLGFSKGSILNLDIPSLFKNVFKTVWEISQKNLIEMAADRQMFIDQSQSFNIYLSKPDPSILTKIHFYGWKKELKTGCYYLRTKPALSSQNFIMDVSKEVCTSCTA